MISSDAELVASVREVLWIGRRRACDVAMIVIAAFKTRVSRPCARASRCPCSLPIAAALRAVAALLGAPALEAMRSRPVR